MTFRTTARWHSGSPGVIGVRVSDKTRTRFAALAAQHQLSVSALMTKLIDGVLANNGVRPESGVETDSSRDEFAGVPADDRISLRLRRGDRGQAAARAEARGMRTGTYLALLIHNHVRATDVLPPPELDVVKSLSAHIAALGRELRVFAAPNTLSAQDLSELRDLMEQLRVEVAAAREASSEVVRRNLQSWEGTHG